MDDNENDVSEASLERFDDMWALRHNEQFDASSDMARRLIREPAIPTGHKMITLTLLACQTKNLDEAKSCVADAKELWDILRNRNPVGTDTEVDECLAGTGIQLDQLESSFDQKDEQEVQNEEEDTEQDVTMGIRDDLTADEQEEPRLEENDVNGTSFVKAREYAENPATPPLSRMEALIYLASSIRDPKEAKHYQLRAENFWPSAYEAYIERDRDEIEELMVKYMVNMRIALDRLAEKFMDEDEREMAGKLKGMDID